MEKIINQFDQKKYELYWQYRSNNHSTDKKRISNLNKFVKCIEKCNMRYWLYDRTLLFAYKVNILSPDNYDQVGMWYKEIKDSKNFIMEIKNAEFTIVKNNNNETWLLRKNRILIIKNFSINNSESVIDGYKIDNKYFIDLTNTNINGYIYNIPIETSNLLEKVYAPSLYDSITRFNKKLFSGNFKFQNFIRSVFLIIFQNTPRLQLVLQKYIFFLRYKRFPNSFYYIKKLSLNEFCQLEIDYDDFNWIMRKAHLDVISNNGEHRNIGQIIDYFKKKNILKNVKTIIKDTPMNHCFSEPICWSRKFWRSGNNFFIYPILYGFRKNVISYNRVNQYIMKNNNINLYSKEYYKSLKLMNDNEIKRMLKKYPLEIIGNGFSSGRHRACAMIGRLIKGEEYLPVYASVLPDPKKPPL